MTSTLNACFISYRHPARMGSLEERLFRHCLDAIIDHVEVYTHNYKVFYDEDRLSVGYQYNETLASDICRSACMIVLYWPAYLESAYCLKELNTMLTIEKKRRRILGTKLRGCRLILPIILRGERNDLPREVREGTVPLDYSRQAINPNFNIGQDSEMSEKLFNMAKYIKYLCDNIQAAGQTIIHNCDTYVFPKAKIIRPPTPETVASQAFQGG